MLNIPIDFESEIQKLRPVTWIYKEDENEIRNIGYIAEELNAIDAFKYVVFYDKEGLPGGIRYDLISLYAIEAIKVAYKKINILEEKIKLIEQKQAL